MVSYDAFLDELRKIAAAKARMTVPQTRKGRRPMRVDTMLRKEKDGSLFKEAEDFGTNKDGYKLQGKTEVQGLPIAIENRKGSVREGENDDGSKWRTKYKLPYGYIEGTKGADGDEVDAYVGPHKDADTAFVVHQKKDDGSYDEDTVMLGFKSKADAKKAILAHYDDPKYVGAVVPVAMERLKGLVAAKKKLTKIAAPASLFPAKPWPASDEAEPKGLKASAQKKPGDVPSLEEPSTYPKAESVQTNRATMIAPTVH